MASCSLEDITLRAEAERYTYTGTFRVSLDAAAGPLQALTTARGSNPHPVPQRFQPYASYWGTGEGDLGAFAQDFEVKRLRSDDHQADTEYVIMVTWSPLEPGKSPGDGEPNPMARPQKLRLEFQETQEILGSAYAVDAFSTRAANSYGPIENSARFRLPEQILTEDRYAVLVATLNFATQGQIAALDYQYRNSVNSKTFYGAPPHFAKWLGAEVTEEIREAGWLYYQGTIRIALGNKPWYWMVDNVGYKYYTGADLTGDLLAFTDDNGFPVSEPGKLARNGTKLNQALQAVKLRYRPEALDYSSIGIGSSW